MLGDPLRSSSTGYLVCFEWSVFVSVSVLFLSIIDDGWVNVRIVLYGVLFMLLETLRTTSKLM